MDFDIKYLSETNEWECSKEIEFVRRKVILFERHTAKSIAIKRLENLLEPLKRVESAYILLPKEPIKVRPVAEFELIKEIN